MKPTHLSRVIPGLLAFVLLLSGCTAQAQSPALAANVVEAMSVPSGAGFARALEPVPFSFPEDHGAHPEYRTEWWYYTGNLQSAGGDDYGFQFTIFRNALTPKAVARDATLASNQVYMAHFAVSDGPARAHYSFERFSRGAGGLAGAQGEPTYGVWLEDWSAREVEPGVVQIVASAQHADGPVTIDLTLRETRPPILQGEQGLHQKGLEAGNASYYYSLPGLETSGEVTTPAGTVAVTGLSWMDHEYGTSALGGDALGWDWFSLQLDNGAALMLYEIRQPEGATPLPLTGALAWPDGTQIPITERDFTITPTRTWTSPRTAATYPVEWEIAVPSQELQVKVSPLIDDQEMQVSFIYWEGAVRAEGMMQGAPVAGRGYVELTGYGQSAGAYQR
jgi:predicted secreted hydrolase